MDCAFTTLGAAIGLLAAIILIVRKFNPVYSLIIGALIGGLAGSGSIETTVSGMICGTKDMMPAVVRILSSGILIGALIKTGAALKIAESIVSTFGEKRAVLAVALATFIITAAGVFVDIAVITIAPVALAIACKAKLSRSIVLLAMLGGGKAGNVVSPNPNTIAVAEAFNLELTDVMSVNIVPAAVALVATVLMCSMLKNRFKDVVTDTSDDFNEKLPPLLSSLSGPLTVIALLSLRPLLGITIDPLIALPCGGFVCIISCLKIKECAKCCEFGLSKVLGVSVLLVATGTIAGIIKTSALQYDLIALLKFAELPMFMLAPISGILMAGATASTTAGSAIAAQTFHTTLTDAGIPAVNAAGMLHAGATVSDSFPHGSFFHATAGAVFMSFNDRIKVMPYEFTVGLVTTIISVGVYLI